MLIRYLWKEKKKPSQKYLGDMEEYVTYQTEDCFSLHPTPYMAKNLAENPHSSGNMEM